MIKLLYPRNILHIKTLIINIISKQKKTVSFYKLNPRRHHCHCVGLLSGKYISKFCDILS